MSKTCIYIAFPEYDITSNPAINGYWAESTIPNYDQLESMLSDYCDFLDFFDDSLEYKLFASKSNMQHFRDFVTSRVEEAGKKYNSLVSDFKTLSDKPFVQNIEVKSNYCICEVWNGSNKYNDEICTVITNRIILEPDNRFLLVKVGGNKNVNVRWNGNTSFTTIETRKTNYKDVYDWLIKADEDFIVQEETKIIEINKEKIRQKNGKYKEIEKKIEKIIPIKIEKVDFGKLNIRPTREFNHNPKHKKATYYNDGKFVSALYCEPNDARNLLRYAIGKFNNLIAYDKKQRKFMFFYSEDASSKAEPNKYHSFHIEDIYDEKYTKGIGKLSSLVEKLVKLEIADYTDHTKLKNEKMSQKQYDA